MGKTTGISWTHSTWNPWQGCTKVSDGCKNCYMYREKKRYGQDPTIVKRSSPSTFHAPLTWARKDSVQEGARIFVCSWSDFFHKDADPWRAEAWQIIQELPNYNFLIPTKRIERAEECLPSNWHDGYHNVWLGVSVENEETISRVLRLSKIPAAIRWISFEPLLGHVPTAGYIRDMDWVVIGGESGLNCRPMDLTWTRDIVAQARAYHIPVFVKQLGGYPYSRHELKDFPEDLQIREFPE